MGDDGLGFNCLVSEFFMGVPLPRGISIKWGGGSRREEVFSANSVKRAKHFRLSLV